jgi:hypothetical protein
MKKERKKMRSFKKNITSLQPEEKEKAMIKYKKLAEELDFYKKFDIGLKYEKNNPTMDEIRKSNMKWFIISVFVISVISISFYFSVWV